MAGTGSYETTEFRRTFGVETDNLLRQRVVLFIGVWGGLGLISLAVMLAMLIATAFESEQDVMSILKDNNGLRYLAISFVWLSIYGTALYVVVRRMLVPRQMLHLSMLLIGLDGVFVVLMRAMGFPMVIPVFLFSHFIGCVLFPWTIRQALTPLLIVLALSTASHLLIESASPGGSVFHLMSNLFMAVPAIGVVGFKHSQRVQKSTNRFLNQRYGMLRQELAFARQVHESLFPSPLSTGALQFSYKYEPMRQIGGDYLYAHHRHCDESGSEQLSIVVIDVTGHGIPAALTVNRIHGEIDLQFAQCADIGPGDMLAVLNRYIHLTLAKHSIYATAVCFRVDMDKGIIRYASGGHPPAFMRGVDGTLRDIDPTAIVLGALDEDEFDPKEKEIEFLPGDSFIVYTDGAIEARNDSGRMMRIDGLREVIASYGAEGSGADCQGLWSERILTQVAVHRDGLPPDDDTLIIEVFRPVGECAERSQEDPDSELESVQASAG
ncbi:MAG: serine/threonine-protein phosphatase [Phycisphaerales bacterium]|nr:serine/threonine-protein phosphatase [Phycisphaerales bacterium]